MNANLIYTKMLSLKAKGKKFILILTKETIKKLIQDEMPGADISNIDFDDMWFAGIHIYLGKMDKIILIEGEIWLE